MSTPRHPTRRWYDSRTDEFAKHVAKDPWRMHIVQQLDKLQRGLMIRYWILVVALFAGGVWLYTVNAQARKAAREAEAAVHQIQKQRFDSIYSLCLDTNRRNLRFNATTNGFIAQLAAQQSKTASAQKKAQIKKAQGQYRTLFGLMSTALAAYHPDCKSFAKQAVTTQTGGGGAGG